MRISQNIKKYLEKYAEKEVSSFDNFDYRFSNVVTIPAFDENFENIKATLDSIHEKNALIILIVNSQENSSNKAKNANIALIGNVKNNLKEIWKAKDFKNISLHENESHTVLLIDRTTNNLQLPNKTGVGLARKIGADIATKLIYDRKITSNWIHCTDADVILPKDYFNATKDLQGCSATIYPYIHSIKTNDGLHKKAMALYELSLRHYVIGLKFANSNFAFHTIGSTIAIDCEAYAKVRGFPIRESGEDFYILNKLVKIGKIHRANTDPIILDGRFSDRVPFGTGKSVEKIAALRDIEDEFLFYNSTIFEKLKLFLQNINDIEIISKIKNSSLDFKKTIDDDRVLITLDKIGAFAAIDTALKSSKTPAICQGHLHTWFDNFRTLKFIHHMRDEYYPSLPIKEIIQQPLYASYNFSAYHSLEELIQEFKKISR